MNIRNAFLAALAAALLSACGSEGSSREGIEITVKALAQGAPHHHHDAEDPADAASKAEHGEIKSFRRSDGVRIDLQLGLINLAPVELQACPSLARLIDRLNPIGSAYAHSGDGGAVPEGPVNLIEEDGTAFGLGEFKAGPGTYCGIVLEIQSGAATAAPKHGGELDTDMTDTLVNVSPCVYAGTEGLSDADAAAATSHHCFQTKLKGEERRISLPFSAPVILDRDHLTLDLTLVVRYEEWFENLDLTLFETDPAEQDKLLDNVAASLHVLSGEEQSLALNFRLEVGGEEAVCGQTYDGLGSSAQPLRMEGFRFYVSGFTLESASDSTPVRLATNANQTVLQDGDHGVALIGHTQGCDAPVGVRNLLLSGVAKAGDYDRVCFDLGVPSTLSHSDPAAAPSPLNVTGMDWSWLFGRIFLKFDAVADPEGTPANFFVHLGSTGCSNGTTPDFGAPPTAECVYPNRPRICLDYAGIAQGHSIVADIAPVIAEVDVTANTPETGPGCMSAPGDPECAAVLPKLNLDFALGDGQLIPRQDQVLFTVGE